MKIIKIIIIILLILVAAFLIIAFFLPTSVHIERSKTMSCSDKIVFQQVNNFHQWKYWSPFAEEDTTMAVYYDGPLEGIGAMMMWKSEKDTGTMTIVESIPSSYIKTVLDFIDRGTAESEWKFSDTDGTTEVTWTLDIMDLGYPIERYYGLMMPSKLEKYYDKGLTNLKVLCENIPEIEGLEIKVIGSQPALIIKDSADVSAIGRKMSQMYGELIGFMNSLDIEMAGPPFTIWHTWDPEKKFIFEAGIPITEKVEGKGRIILSIIPEGKVITAPYYGSYERSGDLHNAIQKYLEVMKIDYIGAPWEVYITDPSTEPDTNKWLTLVYYRIE